MAEAVDLLCKSSQAPSCEHAYAYLDERVDADPECSTRRGDGDSEIISKHTGTPPCNALHAIFHMLHACMLRVDNFGAF